MNQEQVFFGGLAFSCGFFVLSLLIAAKYGLHLLLGRPIKFVWLGLAVGVVACLPLYLAVFEFICQLQTDDSLRDSVAFPMLSMSAMCIAAFGSWMFLRFPFQRYTSPRAIRLAPTLWLVLMLSAGLTVWSGNRFYRIAYPVLDEAKDLIPPGNLDKLNDLVAVTDKGTVLPVATWRVDVNEFEQFDFSKMFVGSPGYETVIPRSSPNHHANCHGWVFTGGSFHLAGEGVEIILKDNGYVRVSKAQADDVVIYRDSRDGIVHTGLVRGVLDDGTVIVESKWSVGSRFLHRPEDQPYSQEFEYYRTHRRGHYVVIERVNPTPPVAPQHPSTEIADDLPALTPEA